MKRHCVMQRMYCFVVLCFIGFTLFVNGQIDHVDAVVKEEAKVKVTPIHIQLDGADYDIPCSVQTLIENGWEWDERTEPFVSLCDYSIVTFTKGELEIGVSLINPTMMDTTDVTKVLVYSIQASPNILTIRDGKGMDETWTKEKIKQTYGNPHLENGKTKGAIETMRNDDLITYVYHYDEITSGLQEYDCYALYGMDVTIASNGLVEKLKLTSLFIDIEQELEDCYVKTNDYKAPTKLGSNPMKFRFELEGTLYQLPVPLETMIQDGWNIEDTITYVPKDTSRTITIRKNRASLVVTVRNDAAYDKKLIYCDIVSLSVEEDTKANIKLPGNIKIGSKQTALQKAYTQLHSTKYTRKQVSRAKQQKFKNASQYTCYEYYKFIPQVNGNKYHAYPDEYYSGIASFDVVDGTIASIVYGQYKTGAMGKVKIAVEEKKITVKTNKDATLYFNYGKEYSSWSSKEGYNITFLPNGRISAHYDGSEWFTGGDSSTYAIDASKKQISVDNGRYVFTYRIVSSERVIFTFSNGRQFEFRTKYVQ